MRGGTTKQSYSKGNHQLKNMKHGGCVYIITNAYNKVLYTGVTSELRARIWEHKTKFYPASFTAKYNCNKIVWYQTFQKNRRSNR